MRTKLQSTVDDLLTRCDEYEAMTIGEQLKVAFGAFIGPYLDAVKFARAEELRRKASPLWLTHEWGDAKARGISSRSIRRCVHCKAAYRKSLVGTVCCDDGARYAADASVTMWALDQFEMWALEFDGAAYHSSKEQVARDKARDRSILFAHSVPVVRFSGNEIFSNAANLVDELFSGLESSIYAKSQFAFDAEVEKKKELEKALAHVSDVLFPFGERVMKARLAEKENSDELVSH